MRPDPIRLPTAIAIVVANMVGTGVFTSLGFQVVDLPTGFPILLLWAIGGVIAFCGAVCYAELAARFPRSGGEYNLLTRGLHPLAGFISGWVSIFAGFTAPIAAAALAFAAYFGKAVGLEGESMRWLAVAVVIGIAVVHLGPTRMTGKFQVALTTFKVVLMLVLIGAAFSLGERPVDPIPFSPQPGDSALIFSGGFAVSLFWVMYAYAGWNAAAYVVGEIDNPSRNLPLALLIGTGFVVVLYLAVNAAFLYVTPREAMAGQIEVAEIAAGRIFGENGGHFVSGLIAFGLLSTISAMTWAGPRVMQVMGEDYGERRLFNKLSQRNRFGVPALAIALQTALVIFGVLVPSFETLINYVIALLTLSSMLVVVAVIRDRIHHPDVNRPYRAWAYPISPAIFLLASSWMLWHGLYREPKAMIGALLTLCLGAAIYRAVKIKPVA